MQTIIDFFQDPVGIAVPVVGVLALLGGAWAFVSRRDKTESSSSEETQPLPQTEESGGEGAEDTSADSSPLDREAEGSPHGEDSSEHVSDSSTAEVVSTGETKEKTEQPESVPSRMTRLRGRLARSGSFGRALLSVFSRGNLSTTDWEEIEDCLLVADLGLDATDELMSALRTRVQVEEITDPVRVRRMLVEELLSLVNPELDRSLKIAPHEVEGRRVPASVLVVGVNGTGKTTTVGKLARVLVAEGKTVLLGAADTFRAAAAEQLMTWGNRVGVEVVRSEREGADPASVAFETLKVGTDQGVDVVLVDTAGRLQTKATLMEELGKVKRVMERHAPLDEVLLVLDATTGQNGMNQARVFAEVAGVTGIVLTKLDGSAKGGIVVSVQRELGVPVKFVGLGEGVDDLAPFEPRAFVEAIVGE